MTWNDVLKLIRVTYKEDALGQQIAEETETEVYCCRQPIGRQEFYLAGQNDIEVSELFIVHPYEYSGENIVRYGDKRLRVVRTYQKNLEELELTCTEKLGDRNG